MTLSRLKKKEKQKESEENKKKHNKIQTSSLVQNSRYKKFMNEYLEDTPVYFFYILYIFFLLQ